MKHLILALVLLGFIPTAAFSADIFKKVATYDGQFLKIPVGARAAGMGSAFTGLADDATAVFWNPAGLARLQGSMLSVNHLNWVADVNLSQGAYVFPVDFMKGIMAISARALYMDQMKRTTVFKPTGDGTKVDAGYSTFGVSFARSLTDKFSVGFTTSWVHAGLDDLSSSTLAFDLGTLYDTGYRSLRIGMSIQNMGTSELSYVDDIRAAKIPMLFRVGASMNLYQAADHVVITTAEFSHPPDNTEHLNWGTEYTFKDFMFFRGGYNFGYDAESFAAGMGVRFPTSLTADTRFDYSYTGMNDLGSGHRFSLELNF